MALLAYAMGYWVGRSSGHAEGCDRLSETMKGSRIYEPASPQMDYRVRGRAGRPARP